MARKPNGSPDEPESSSRGWETTDNESEADREAVYATLSYRIPVNFQDNRLVDVLDFIAKRTNLDIQTDWRALEEIGVDPDSPVSLRVRNARLSSVLDRVLEIVSDPDIRAGWTVRDGWVVVSSDDEIRRRHTSLRVHPIGDLLQDIETAGGEPKSREQLSSELIDSITRLVDPEGWQINGGDSGTIIHLGTSLHIRTTVSIHEQIGGLLEAFRKSRTRAEGEAVADKANADRINQDRADDANRLDRPAPTMRDLASEVGISDDTFRRVRVAAGIKVTLKGAKARNRRYSPAEVDWLILAARNGTYLERAAMAEKWARWGSNSRK